MAFVAFLIALTLASAVFLILYPLVCKVSKVVDRKLEEKRKLEEEREKEEERLMEEMRKQQEIARAERMKRDEQRQAAQEEARKLRAEENKKKTDKEIEDDKRRFAEIEKQSKEEERTRALALKKRNEFIKNSSKMDLKELLDAPYMPTGMDALERHTDLLITKVKQKFGS